MRLKKVFKYKKGDIVFCTAFVNTVYEFDAAPLLEFGDITAVHIPSNDRGFQRKILLKTKLAPDWKHPFLVVGIKQIQTGYYYKSIPSTSNWTGEYEGVPASFEPDCYHDVYVLESMQLQRWSKLDYALECDLLTKH